MALTLTQWVNKWNGKYADFDGNYGPQCADLFNYYVTEVAGGRDIFSYMGAQEIALKKLTFGGVFTHYPPSILGKAGDVIIWSGSFGSYLGGGWGHVAILVEDEKAGTGIVKVLTQNPGPAQILNLSTNGCIGYLRPKSVTKAPPKVVTGTNQRVVGSAGVNYRKSPNTKAAVVKLFKNGDILDFKGYITNGEKVAGSSVWFVGAYTGGYAHSSGFTNPKTTGLKDLTPKATPVPPKPVTPAPVKLNNNQRKMKVTGNQRNEPNTSSTITASLEKDFIFTVKGFVTGQPVEGNPIWFVGANSGDYVWSGLTNSVSVAGLTDLTPKAAPVPPKPVTPTPAPVTPKPTPVPPEANPDPVPVSSGKLVAELPCITEVIEAHPDNYAVGNMPDKVTGVVTHQFGTKGKDTLSSSINWFVMGQAARNPNIETIPVNKRVGPSSAHILVSGKRIVQMVSLNNRAYHSGPGGNDFWSIEIDPYMDEDTINSVITVLTQLQEKAGRKLETYLHKDIPGAITNCGRDVPAERFKNIPLTASTEKDKIVQALNDLIEMIKEL